MKKLIILTALLLCSCALFAQDKKAILKVLEDQRQAWNQGDLDTFMKGYWKSDSLMFIGQDKPVYGWQTTLDNYKKNYRDKGGMGFLTFNIIKVSVLDATHAFVVGGWHLKREKDAPSGYYTLLFRKINGVWKIVCDHSS